MGTSNIHDHFDHKEFRIKMENCYINNNWEMWRFQKKTIILQPRLRGGSNTIKISALNTHGCPTAGKNAHKIDYFQEVVQ